MMPIDAFGISVVAVVICVQEYRIKTLAFRNRNVALKQTYKCSGRVLN